MTTPGVLGGGAEGVKFTPGPWICEEDNETLILSEPTGAHIGRVYDASDFPCFDPETDEEESAFESEVRANARLFAAAPDLLESVRAFLQAIGSDVKRAPDDHISNEMYDAWLLGSQALKKAEGVTP